MRKDNFYLEFTTDQQEPITFPIGIVEGAKPGPTIAIVGGVHGAECCGIAAAIELYQDLNPEDICGKVIICTCFNKEAFEQHMAFFVPRDMKSPLMGDCTELPENATYSEYMTHFFQTKVLDGIDYFVELHGGDVPEGLVDFVMYPLTGNKEIDDKSKQIAVAYDIPFVLHLPTNTPSTPGTKVTESCFMVMASKGIPALLAETGEFGLYNSNNADIHLKGLKNILRSIGILDEDVIRTKEQKHRQYVGSMRSPLNGLWYPFKSIGDIVKKDELVGKIADYFGETIIEIHAPHDGEIVAMRNNLYVNIGHAMYYLIEPEGK